MASSRGFARTRPRVLAVAVTVFASVGWITMKDRGESRFHRALLLDYPNADDVARFRAAEAGGLLAPGASPGGLIEVHGEGGRGPDWTDGCIALPNDRLDVLWALVEVGTPVTVVGSLGNAGRSPDGIPDRRP